MYAMLDRIFGREQTYLRILVVGALYVAVQWAFIAAFGAATGHPGTLLGLPF
jgi:hypothetical protein